MPDRSLGDLADDVAGPDSIARRRGSARTSSAGSCPAPGPCPRPASAAARARPARRVRPRQEQPGPGRGEPVERALQAVVGRPEQARTEPGAQAASGRLDRIVHPEARRLLVDLDRGHLAGEADDLADQSPAADPDDLADRRRGQPGGPDDRDRTRRRSEPSQARRRPVRRPARPSWPRVAGAEIDPVPDRPLEHLAEHLPVGRHVGDRPGRDRQDDRSPEPLAVSLEPFGQARPEVRRHEGEADVRCAQDAAPARGRPRTPCRRRSSRRRPAGTRRRGPATTAPRAVPSSRASVRCRGQRRRSARSNAGTQPPRPPAIRPRSRSTMARRRIAPGLDRRHVADHGPDPERVPAAEPAPAGRGGRASSRVRRGRPQPCRCRGCPRPKPAARTASSPSMTSGSRAVPPRSGRSPAPAARRRSAASTIAASIRAAGALPLSASRAHGARRRCRAAARPRRAVEQAPPATAPVPADPIASASSRAHRARRRRRSDRVARPLSGAGVHGDQALDVERAGRGPRPARGPATDTSPRGRARRRLR